MGGASSSSSVLANAVARKEKLARVRGALLDQPGVPRRGGPPPPVVPAQGRKSPQQKTLSRTKSTSTPTATPSDQPAEGVPPDEQAQTPVIDVDPETRAEMLQQATLFLQHVRQAKRAQLHKTLGRARRFWGRGI